MAASSKQEAERLARIHEALELASGGAFAEAVDAISVEAEDALGGIERGLRGLVADFRIAVAQSDEAISELTSAKTELQQRLATIEQQQAAIRELSSPIIDVWDGVITIPLVGLIDSERIADLHGRLLTHIADTRTAWVLMDLTGIDLVDTCIADSLMKLARSVRLMGAACILTGIGPRVAQTLETLGVSLEGLRTMATLKQGLRYCISQQR